MQVFDILHEKAIRYIQTMIYQAQIIFHFCNSGLEIANEIKSMIGKQGCRKLTYEEECSVEHFQHDMHDTHWKITKTLRKANQFGQLIKQRKVFPTDGMDMLDYYSVKIKSKQIKIEVGVRRL